MTEIREGYIYMLTSIKSRIKALETAKNAKECNLIGRFFDELTEEEQNEYCHYRYNCTRDTLIELEFAINPDNNLHFICDAKPKAPTKDELRAIQEEIQFIIEEVQKC